MADYSSDIVEYTDEEKDCDMITEDNIETGVSTSK